MRNREGFTLVELIIVVLIIGALAVIAIPRISTTAATAKSNGCKANIDTLNTQLELYYATNGSWPAALPIISGDTNYFPDGVPVCPVSDAAYPSALVNYRVDDSAHSH